MFQCEAIDAIIMSGKDLPKLRLIKERQATGPASLAIRFNAMMRDDDDDDEDGFMLPTPSPEETPSPKIPTEQTPPSTSARHHSPGLPPAAPMSVSAPSSYQSSASTRENRNSTDNDKSFLGEIKERLPDEITAIIDRIENKSSDKEKGPVLKKNNSQESIATAESDITEQERSRSNSIDTNDVFLPPLSTSPPSSPPLKSFDSIPTDEAIEATEDTKSSDSSDSKGKPRRLSPLRRFRNNSGKSDDKKDNGSSSPVSSSPLRRFRGNKHEVKDAAVSTVTMSSLLTNTKDDEEELLLADDEEEFFDPKEETIVKNLEEPTTEPKSTKQTESKEDSLSSNINKVPGSRLVIIVSVVIACLFAPLPPYLAGLILGALVGGLAMMFYQWLTRPPQPKPELILEPLDKLPPLQVPEMRESSNDPGNFKVSKMFCKCLLETHLNVICIWCLGYPI